MKHSENKKNTLVWIITLVISAALMFAAHTLVIKGTEIMTDPSVTVKAEVIELGEYYEHTEDEIEYVLKTQFFTIRFLSGPNKGETARSYQQMDNYTETGERFVKVGDKIIVFDSEDGFWPFAAYSRFDTILILGIAFLILLIFFGRIKGLSTVISLAYTCLAVFYVFLPAILAGRNVYIWTVLVCVFTIIMTLLLTNGISSKSVNTMLGCGFGVLSAALLTVLFSRIMHLTGVIDEHSVYLQIMNEQGGSIDLKGLIFAMITIGALGAVMDVAMDIASSLYEVSLHAPDISFGSLFKSGMNIGRDVMGTMANTLVLAYIGSSLCSILLRVSYANSMMMLLNTEGIIVELLQALLGSLGILLTIPLTAIVCCFAYTGRHEK